MQSGVCLTYLIFVPHNFHSSFLELTGQNVSPNIFLFVMLLVEIPLSWIRDIRKLTVTNTFANCLILYGLITCLAFAFGSAIQPSTQSTTSMEEDNDVNVINGTTTSEAAEAEDIIDDESTTIIEGRGPLAEIMYKLVHLTPFNSDGWFLFIGTSVRTT